MAMKLPRATIEELDSLVEQLGKPDPDIREPAMTRLMDYERDGRIPVEALIEFSESENPTLSMYAISALGRNAEPAAVKKLIELAGLHQAGNVLFLETIVDALGETRNPGASATLLGLVGIRMGRGGLLGRLGRKDKEEDDAATLRRRERLALPVLRALDKIADPKAAQLIGDYLGHEDSLVRWHAIQTVVKCNLDQFNDRIRKMASDDENDLVREAASIAMDRLASPLPPNMNN